MIARVVPIRRLPKSLEIFDYKIPENLSKKIKPGQMVRTPFQKSKIFGLVFSIEDTSDAPISKIKDIDSIVNKKEFLSKQRLSLFKKISDIYNISFPAFLKINLLPIQKRKLKKIELNKLSFKQKNKKLNNNNFKLYKNKQEHKNILSELKNKSLIIVPEQRFIQDIEPNLKSDNVLVWHSNLSQKKQFSRWTKIRNNQYDLVIGTRSAVFLPFQQLNQILIDYEHDENHKHWDQSPRFHTHDIAEELKKLHGANLTFSSFSPSCKTYFGIYKNKLDCDKNLKEKISSLNTTTTPEIIKMKDERKAGNYDIFSEKAQNLIKNTKKDTFILINRLGYATSIGCNDCGYTTECSKCNLPLVYHKKTKTLHCHYCKIQRPLPTTCPKCKTKVVELRGTGTEMLEQKAKELSENENKNVVRIDSNSSNPKIDKNKSNIIIGTDMAFQFLDWKRLENVVFINIDQQLSLPEFKISENIWHKIQQVQYYKNTDCNFYIQTIKPKQTLIKSLAEPDRFYRMDLNSRKNLEYPPYVFLVRYFYGDKDYQKSRQEAERVQSKLSEKLTKAEKSNIIISEPIEMHPKYYRNKFWHTFLVKIKKDNWKEKIVKINNNIPDKWKVDPNPISILSP